MVLPRVLFQPPSAAGTLETCQKHRFLPRRLQTVRSNHPCFNKLSRGGSGTENHYLIELKESIEHIHSGPDFEVSSILCNLLIWRSEAQSREKGTVRWSVCWFEVDLSGYLRAIHFILFMQLSKKPRASYTDVYRS